MRHLTVDHFVASPLTILKRIASATAFCIPAKSDRWSWLAANWH